MNTEPGDHLIIATGSRERVGIVLGAAEHNGHPRCLVHWVTGDYDALIQPGPAVRLVRRQAVPGLAAT